MMNKKTGLIALLASLAAGEALAGTLTSYAPGDVLVCFRNGQSDMVVDAGPISTLTNTSPNQVIPITQYTGTQLAQVGTNSVSWSAFTWFSDNTLFVTKPRILQNAQTSPWRAQSSSVQSGTALRMATIPPGASNEMAVFPQSTASAILEPESSASYTVGLSYATALNGQYGGNFNGTFVGNPENTTTSTFTTSGQVQRSDFYRMTPTSGFAFGQFLGYFELNTDGTMRYVAYPSTIPIITSITSSNSMTTINYTAGFYGTYTLRATNTLTSGVPAIQWPAVSVLTSGDTAQHSISFTDTNSTEFYIITAQ